MKMNKSYYIDENGKRKLTEERKKQMREYQKSNIEKINKYQKDYRKKNNPNNLATKWRTHINHGIQKKGWVIGSIQYILLGFITFDQYKTYIESKWEKGMNWDNRGIKKGQWSIDHIICLSSAKDESELLKLMHYTNTQPMWHTDNMKKRDKPI